MIESQYFHVFKSGKLTVIGFDATHIDKPSCAHECQTVLFNLLDQHECDVLAVDLSDVPAIASWILGILAAVRQRGTRVDLYHPSVELDGVLTVTHLDEMLPKRGFAETENQTAMEVAAR